MTETALFGATGVPREDRGPVLGPGWWHGLAFILLVLGWVIGGLMFFEKPGTDEARKLAVVIAVAASLPMLLSAVQVIRLKRAVGTAQLFVPYEYLPLGFSGAATYVRPLRGGATVRQIEGRLQCEEKLITGSGKNQRTHTKIVYDEPVTPVTTPMMNQMHVQVPFRIPENGPASMDHARANIQWYLRLRLKMDGCPNTRSSFQVYVMPAMVKR